MPAFMSSTVRKGKAFWERWHRWQWAWLFPVRKSMLPCSALWPALQPAPAGSVPAAVLACAQSRGLDRQRMVNALFTASAIGIIIGSRATVSGAEGGCQAECGAAAAMGAAAVTEMLGGSPEAAFHAAAMALKNVLGLTCDPVAGLVEIPCIKRNASGAMNALLSADLALAGVSDIPFDEVVDAMYAIGKAMPQSVRGNGQRRTGRLRLRECG